MTLVCPSCRTPLAELACSGCRCSYSAEDGIAVLAPAAAAANTQASYYDESVDEEFEIARPHGTPALYGWLLGEKFRRSVAGIDLRGRSVLAVCAGSGMDAEFLARAGARVVAADISPGAARRTRERARRRELDITPVVADVERLPFADRSFDVVYVHDGLHHLEHPERGLAEMARVARVAVCVSEPAQAAVTALAIRVGLAQDVEEAGNRVARLDPRVVAGELARRGFRPLRAERYAMLYRHEPGPISTVLSRPGLFLLARAALRGGNALVGRWGNKLTVTAVRA